MIKNGDKSLSSGRLNTAQLEHLRELLGDVLDQRIMAQVNQFRTVGCARSLAPEDENDVEGAIMECKALVPVFGRCCHDKRLHYC